MLLNFDSKGYNMNTNDERRSSTHYFGVESWQTRHDKCLRIQREIATSLADRDRLPTTSHRYSNLNEQIHYKHHFDPSTILVSKI